MEQEAFERELQQTQKLARGQMMIPVLLTFVLTQVRTEGSLLLGWPIVGLFVAMSVVFVSLGPVFRASLLRGVDSTRPQGVGVAVIIAVSMAEMPSLLGFVLCFMGLPWWGYGAFVGLSAVGYALSFPTRRRYERWVESAGGNAAGAHAPGFLGTPGGSAETGSSMWSAGDGAVPHDTESGSELAYKKSVVVGLSMIPMAFLVSGIGIYLNAQGGATRVQEADASLALMLLGISAVEVVLAYFMPGVLQRSYRTSGFAKTDSTSLVTAAAMIAIVRMALSLVPSLFGMVAMMMGAPAPIAAAFPALSLLGFAAFFPRRSQVSEWYESIGTLAREASPAHG